MTDFKIQPPVQPPQPQQAEQTESTQRSGRPFELGGQEPSPTASTKEASASPAALVEQLRAGQLDMEQVVDLLIDQALASQPAASASETTRREIRQALTELVRDDPTLAALASAMKR